MTEGTAPNYTCGLCGKKFLRNESVGGRCAVLHPEGTCCHFGQTEIPKTLDMTLISKDLTDFIDEGEGFMATKRHEPDELDDILSKITLHYKDGRIWQEGADEAAQAIQSLIDKACREARIDEVSRLYHKTPPENGMDGVIGERLAELTQHKSEE